MKLVTCTAQIHKTFNTMAVTFQYPYPKVGCSMK